MAKVTTPPERWIDEGLRALASGGPQAVRIDVLAKELGVSRGGFYWHFTDRRALLDRMLDVWEEQGVDDVIAELDARGGTGRERLHELFAIAAAHPERLPIELAIRDWARGDADVKARLTRVDDRRMQYMRQLFGEFVADPLEVEVRAFLVFSAWVANDLIAATHVRQSRDDVIGHALKRLLS